MISFEAQGNCQIWNFLQSPRCKSPVE